MTAKFLSDGTGIEVSGEGDGGEGSIGFKFEWDDNPKKSGLAVGQLHVAGKTFKQKKEKGSITKTIYVKLVKLISLSIKDKMQVLLVPLE